MTLTASSATKAHRTAEAEEITETAECQDNRILRRSGSDHRSSSQSSDVEISMAFVSPLPTAQQGAAPSRQQQYRVIDRDYNKWL